MNFETSSWHSYPKIHALGHAAIKELLLDPVLVEEKADGSQFSFGAFYDEEQKERILKCRSKGSMLNTVAVVALFVRAVETATKLFDKLHDEWTYRCEYLAKPKHNTLSYDRIPKDYLIIFDINTGNESYLSYEEKKAEADRLGLECVPLLHTGKIGSEEIFRELLKTPSVLGGQLVEGVVIKNYGRFGRDGKALMGKFVSEAFKETHAGEWKERNPKQGDIVQRLISIVKTDARWHKAVQHLRERGEIEDSPRDIGKLIKEAKQDIADECKEELVEIIWEWAKPAIQRGATSGIAEWYKDQLLKKQFEKDQNG
jgi:hypothetical protein